MRLRGAVAAVLVVLASSLVTIGPAFAQGDEAEGRRHWKRGQDYYSQGKFPEAAREFEAGYAAAPKPLFLLNIGHSYRRAGELTKAKSAYETLLRLQPNIAQRAEIESHIRNIDDALTAVETEEGARQHRKALVAAAAEKSSPVDPSLSEGAEPRLSSLPIETTAPPPPVLIDASPANDSDSSEGVPVYRRTWFWLTVGAIVLGGATAAFIALRPVSSCQATVCITER